MSMFDDLLSNLEEIAGKLGLPAWQLQRMIRAVNARVAEGSDMMAAVKQVAQEQICARDGMPMIYGRSGLFPLETEPSLGGDGHGYWLGFTDEDYTRH